MRKIAFAMIAIFTLFLGNFSTATAQEENEGEGDFRRFVIYIERSDQSNWKQVIARVRHYRGSSDERCAFQRLKEQGYAIK